VERETRQESAQQKHDRQRTTSEWGNSPVLFPTTLSLFHTQLINGKDRSIYKLQQSLPPIFSWIITHIHSPPYGPLSLFHTLLLTKETQRLPLFVASGDPTLSRFLTALLLSSRPLSGGLVNHIPEAKACPQKLSTQ